MAYVVTALPDYVKQNNFPLLRRSVFGAKTAGLLTLQSGVKSSASLNIMDTEVVFQADGCSRTASGDTTFTQRILEVAPIAIHQDFCPKALEKKYLQTELKAGSRQDEKPFEESFTELLADRIAATLETAIWQGDTAVENTNPNTNKFDGLLKLIDGASGVIDGNTGEAESITVSNIEAIMDAMYQAIPTSVLDAEDLRIFIGMDVFRLYTIALKNSNLYHYDGQASDFEIVIPATNVRVVGVNGLNGTDRIVAARLSNLFLGVDLEDEEEDFEMWYSPDDRVVKLSVAFKYGVQFAFPDEIVEFTVADNG